MEQSPDARTSSCLASILYQRPSTDQNIDPGVELHNVNQIEDAVLLEALIAEGGSSENADLVLQYLMVFLNVATVQPSSDIIPPLVRNMDDVILAAAQTRSLIF